MGYKTRVRNMVKQIRTAIAAGNVEEAQEELRKTMSFMQKTASKGVIHRKNASRRISRLAGQVHQLRSA
jgi:small subunit ribosomal protein S20